MKSRMLLAAIAMSFGLVSYATVMPTVAWTNNLDTVQNGYAITLGDGCTFSNGAAVVGGSGGISIDIDNMPTAVSVLVKYRNCKPQPTSAVVISAAVQSTYGDTSHEIGVRSDGGNTNNVTGYWQVGANYPFGSVALPEFGYILFSLSALHGTGAYVGSNISSLIGGINSTLKFSNTGAYRITIGAATGTKANVTYSSWDGLMVEQVAVFENSYLSPADVQSHFFAENPVTGESVAYSYKYVGGGTWNAEDWIAPDNEYPDSAPALSGSNLWYPIVIDDGQTVTAGNVEGWTLQFGLYNGSSLTIPSLFKWQGGCSVCVDKDSQLTISSLGEGTYGDDVNFYVAAPTGITYGCDYDKNGASFYYHFAEDGSVLYQNLNGGSHTIKTADIYLSGAETKTLKSKELVAFESSSINFAANATIKVKYGENEIYQVQISSIRSDGVSLTADGDVGECELVQTSSGIYLYYVDGKPDSKDKYAIAAWKNGDEIESSAGCFDIGFGSTLNLNGNVFDEDGNILISGDKGVLLDWADALSNMTIFVWCSMPCINENSALATIARQGYSDDIIGVSLATNAMTSGIWLGAPFLNATSSSAASVGNDVCFALAYQNFFEQFPCGTELYEFIDGSMTKIYSSIPLRSIGFFNGCAIGGARTSENFASLAGMKISAVAVYDECLDPSQIWSVAANGAQKIPSNDMIGDGASLVMAKVSNVAVRQHSPWEGVICLDFSIDCDDNVIDVPITINVRDNESGCLLPIGTIYFDGVAMGSHSLSAKHGDHHVVLDVAEYNPRYDSGMVLVEVAIDEFYSRYMVVDLSSGPEGAKYPVHFIDEVPPEGWSEGYKTTNMVLRLVESGAFQMGCGPSETGYFGEYEATPHIVELTKPFYMGVFEVTQRQFELIAGTNTSSFVGAMRPVDSIPMTMIRGEASNFGGNWPMDNYVAKDSFVGRMRIKTGIGSFDLPTEAEWEYACRAGTTSALNSGKDLSDENMAEVGRFHGNDDDGQYTSTVGNYMPNAWGLYDMHGNIWEWCLDWYQNGSSFSTNSVIDPLGPSNGNRRVARGGAWISGARVCRSAHREGWLPTIQYPTHGMRVRCYRSNVVGDYASEISSGLIELKKQTHIVSCGEMVHVPYSPEWLGAESCTLSVDGGVVLASNGPGEFAWTPNSPGIHMLTLASGDVHMNTIFRVLPANVVLVRSEEITNNVLWDANNVYVIDGILRVASGAVLTIPSGTIVKLVEGSAVVVEPGGCCIARGAIFTHIADDSVGGDTMGDGDGTVPGYGQYSIDDAVVGDDKTELRYLDSVVYVGGVLSGDVVWWGRRVYRITSNVDVPVDSRLTVLPGTILKFDPGTRMNVYGALDVQGTRYAPVVFTSIKDDKFGGDTNCDSDNSYPEGGDWDGVWVYGGKADMKYASLLYSGSINERGAVQAFNSKGLYDNSNNTFPNAEILMDCCEIAHSKFDGIVNVTGGNISVTNTVIHDVNWATGPFSGPTNEYVNCVFYGNSVGLCYWENGRWRGKPVYKNCVFANCINGWCERALNVYGDPSQEVTILNCLFWNEPGFGSDACNRIGSDGNIWGDPKFVDPYGGDFRIVEGSLCVDAAEIAYAPETDRFGQPRINAPEIGVCEVVPRGITSNIDLVPQSVTADAEAVPGQPVTIEWVTRNVGGATAIGTWRDTVSLVSVDSGRVVELGDYIVGNGLIAGGTINCSAQFIIPAIPEGAWFPKVNINSYRDVFEGALADNNALVGSSPVLLEVDVFDHKTVHDGVINGGAPTVLKLTFDDDDENRMVKLGVPAGAKVSWGFGFMPIVGAGSDCLIAEGGEIGFKVPDDEGVVYIVIENSLGGAYTISTASDRMILSSMEPASVAFGEKVAAILHGDGFPSTNVVASLVSASGKTGVSCSYIDAGTMILSIDTMKLSPGVAYGVEISGERGEATLEGAFFVTAPSAKPLLSARLDVPSSARQGRITTGYVEYSNDGTAEMDAPVFSVTTVGDDILMRGRDETNAVWTNILWIVGIGTSYPAGRLKPGESVRIPFEFMVKGAYRMDLNVLDETSSLPRDSVYPTWKSFSSAIAASATAVNGADGFITDYGFIYDHAIRAGYGDDCGVVRGTLSSDADGSPLAGRTVLAIDKNNLVVGEAKTSADGRFCFDTLNPTNAYSLTVAGIQSTLQTDIVPVLTQASPINLYGHDFATFGVLFMDGNNAIDAAGSVPVLYCQNGARYPVEPKEEAGRYAFMGVPDGEYILTAYSESNAFWTAASNVEVRVAYGKTSESAYSIPMTKGGRIILKLTLDGIPAVGVSCHASGEIGTVSSESDEDGVVAFNLLPGEWELSVGDGYKFSDGYSDAVVVSACSTLELTRSLSFIPFTAFPDVGPYPLPVRFSVDFLPDLDGVSSYDWDFDGDGVSDSFDASPTFTYNSPGKKHVELKVVYTNGISATYSDDAAVDVWEDEYVELDESTMLLDEASGYRLVTRSEDKLVLEYTREAVPVDLSSVQYIVIPGEENLPLSIIGWKATDDAYLEIDVSLDSAMKAYGKMRLMSLASLSTASGEDQMCHYKEKLFGPFEFAMQLENDGKWKKRGTAQTRKGEVACEIIFRTGDILYTQAIEKDDDGKIVFWESRFKGEWTPDLTISGKVGASRQNNRYGRGVKGNPYKPLAWEDQLLFMAGPVPVSGSIGAEFSATANFGGELRIKPRFAVDYGFRRGAGNKDYSVFRPADRGHELSFAVEGSVELYAGLFAEIYAGANKKAGSAKVGLKIADLNIGAGIVGKAEAKIFTENEPDEYSLGIFGRFELDFAPVEVNIGIWKWKPFNVGFHPEDKKIIGFDTKTPIPSLKVTRDNSDGGNATVRFENNTKYGKWDCSSSTLYYGDRSKPESLPHGKKISHSYAVSGDDTRKYEAKLVEQYSFKIWNYPILNPCKARTCTITVTGRRTNVPTEHQHTGGGTVPKSVDPNEMAGPLGLGDPETQRFVKPGEELTYTIYFENKSDATAAAQEVYVTNPLSEWLDWSTLEMGEVAFNNQIDLGLSGKNDGSSEVTMKGTNFLVRTTLELVDGDGRRVEDNAPYRSGVSAKWYMRIVDPTTDTGWPADILAGFLPPNDETFRGEGHLTYRIKVREDAPANVVIANSATIVFDYNEPIETDPAWWNTVAPTVGTALFAEPEIVADEGSNVVVRVSGGNMYSDSSVKLYLTYNTAAAADVDIAKGMINGETPKGGLKFPLTLNWEAGEIGEKVITIPVKTDKTVEDDEFFTLQLAEPVAMELGDAKVCTVTINDPGYDELAGKIAAGTATKAEQTAWDKLQKAKAPYIRGLADTAERGKVAGSGLCAPGKKVTLKATANKDFVFMGWSQGAGNGESASAEAAADKQGTDNGFVAKTASLVIDRTAKPAANSATSTTLTGITEDSTFFANFITSAEDKASVTAGLNGTELLPDEGASPFSTNVWAGVYIEWPVAADALSQTTVKVSGLPSGLKFTAKPVTSKIGSGMTAVVVTNVPANTIYGAPTAASKVGRDGSVAPYQVKITVTTAGKSSVTYLANIIVDPLPAWAVGTFDGAVGNGSATMSVTSVGKVSGKLSLGGTNWTFKADSYAMNGGSVGVTNFMVVSEAVAGKATMPIALTLSDLAIGYLPDTAAACAAGTFGDIASALYRVVWADKGDAAAAALVASCAGAYSFKAAYGDTTGDVAFTLDEKGAIKGAVVLPDGAKTRKASFSANALAEPDGLHVLLSLPPDARKGYSAVFEDRVLVGCSGAADDSHVFRDPGVIVVTAPLYGASDASGSVAVSPKYGQVAEGKTVTLKATPAKNCVFVGWYDGETLLSQAASYSCAATGADMTFAAKFVTTEEDRRNVVLSVNGMTVSDDEAAAPYRGVVSTNITCGIALNWPIDASALSATTVKVAGLPAGLKFDSRTNVIFGTPTAAKAGDVKITVTTAGKTSVTYLLKLTVDPLPDWVVGQFYGIVNCHGDLSLSGDLWENTSIAEISISKDGKVNACSREANNYLWKDATTLYVDDAGVYRFDVFHVNGMEWWRERFSVSAEPVSDGGTPLGCIVGEEEGVDWGGSPFVSNWRAIQDAYSAKPIGLPLPKFNTNDAICRFNVHAVSSRFDWIAEDGVLTLKFSTNGAVTPTWSGETQFKMIGAHLTPYHVDDKGTVSAMLMVQGVDKAKGCAIGLYCVLAIPCEANGNAKASEVELTAETVIIDCL